MRLGIPTGRALACILAGNRTAVALNGAAPAITTYNLANQITNAGYSYDLAGNLANDGTATYTYDALNRTTARGGTTYAYNGDGVLVSQAASGVTTRYTQDLASPLTQVLQTFTGTPRTDYLYGANRLATLTSGVRTWYVSDALGSVRRTVSDAGVPLGVVQYDPWGTVESGSVPTFGFTGELQQGGAVYLRARWYSSANGRFTAYRWRMSESNDEIPYSHHPYAYALSNPVLYTDPAGTCAVSDDGEDCHKPSRYPDPRNSVVCPEGWSWGGPSQPECLRNSDYAKVPPTDIGIMIGVSLSGAASGVVGGTVGVERKCSQLSWSETVVYFAYDAP